ncbi:hypothetical protein BKA69DRAFT_1053347 [Paraphysoderma sedebokerense]|nr:hypothetical protein BKA69DRAFT_1053347 [Paraphysoderma sedebokerense]
MILDCLIVNVDTGNGTYRMIVSYSTNKLDTNNRLNSNVSVWVRGVRKDFARNDRLGSSDLTFSFKESKPRAYPFDAHIGEFDVSGLYIVNGIQSDLPFRIGLDIAVPGFKLRKEYISTNPSFVITKFSIIRSNITIGFSLFIVMLNWLLSLIMAFLAIQILIKNRPVPPPLIVPGLALLFALPQLRSVQPGVPPIPATSDVVGFFWNICFRHDYHLVLHTPLQVTDIDLNQPKYQERQKKRTPYLYLTF